ncbi:hypothetical protein CGRA01v4_11698 [Colletotrichum graminicola]|nr:hypothetical protein CGRA01v4_11698 [Colletotrichum graminicola]
MSPQRRASQQQAQQPVDQPGSIRHLSPASSIRFSHHQCRRHRGRDAAIKKERKNHRHRTSSKEAVSNHYDGRSSLQSHQSMEAPPRFFAPPPPQISTLTTTYEWLSLDEPVESSHSPPCSVYPPICRQPDENRDIHPVRLLSSRVVASTFPHPSTTQISTRTPPDSDSLLSTPARTTLGEGAIATAH